MRAQLSVEVRWSPTTKRWLIVAQGRTTLGPAYFSAVAETSTPMTAEAVELVADYVRMALEGQYPF